MALAAVSSRCFIFAICLAVSVAQNTGLICFSCPSTYNPDQCRTHVTCQPDQACSVQEVIQPHGVVQFWSGCEDVGICGELAESSQMSTIIGRRQASYENKRCVYCCSKDLCNHNCTSFVNLALHKPAYQSTVGAGGTPDRAVDGDTTKNFSKGSCMHTGAWELYPWWAVDLGHEYHVTNVKMHMRDEPGLAARSYNLQVLVSPYNATSLDRASPLFTQCGHYVGHSSDGDVITIQCPANTTGRWVRVQESSAAQQWLHLCEVEVFGF